MASMSLSLDSRITDTYQPCGISQETTSGDIAKNRTIPMSSVSGVLDPSQNHIAGANAGSFPFSLFDRKCLRFRSKA